ncbi:MAG: hypothetical protein QHH19_01860 [Candidatus Thermoplasmatota archaeon]|jgi:transposase-like protein|nr:hypothetical protein [Candidatus Thermoplasmatota archaeon]
MICPWCESKNVIKKGKRKTIYKVEQVYYCKNCRKRFVDGYLKHRVYSTQVIYHALNYYNLGFTLDETSRLVNKKYKVKTSKTTVYSWVNDFQNLCPILGWRDNFSSYDDVLFTKRFEHENLDYTFMYHKYKLDVLTKKQFPLLFRYITRFEGGCPDVFFEVGERCSKPSFEADAVVRKTCNLACKMAGFAAQATEDNRERHKLVETFMVINDRATIACEVPVWYWEKNVDDGVTGHVDVLQVRNNLVYILDYKPGASKDKKAPWQLYHYARALSFRTKIPLQAMRCAWFDENVYYEYSPSEAKIKPVTKKVFW